MANALDKARQALETARSKINEWDRALDQARADRAKAEQAAPADPAELDQYADTYTRAAGKIRAAEQGRKVAASAEMTALEEVVRAGLDDAKAGVKAAQKAHDDHRRKLDALLGKVSELDGADYRPVDLYDVNPNGEHGTFTVKGSRAAVLRGEIHTAEVLVKHLTEVLEKGDIWPGRRGEVPAYALEYVDARREAGIPTTAEAEQAAAIERDRLEDGQGHEEAGHLAYFPKTRFSRAGR